MVETAWLERMLARLKRGGRTRSFDGDDAPEGRLRASPGKRGIRIRRRQILLRHFFLDVEEAELTHLLPGGAWSAPMRRVNIDRGDSAAAVAYEPRTDLLHFTRQFRYPTYDYENEYQPENGWITEIPAGRIREKETPAQCVEREIGEELGAAVVSLAPVGDFFLTPGASSEKLHLFYAEIELDDALRRAPGGETPDEYVEKIAMRPADFFAGLDRSEWRDAKTIIGGEWLRQRIGSGYP